MNVGWILIHPEKRDVRTEVRSTQKAWNLVRVQTSSGLRAPQCLKSGATIRVATHDAEPRRAGVRQSLNQQNRRDFAVRLERADDRFKAGVMPQHRACLVSFYEAVVDQPLLLADPQPMPSGSI